MSANKINAKHLMDLPINTCQFNRTSSLQKINKFFTSFLQNLIHFKIEMSTRQRWFKMIVSIVNECQFYSLAMSWVKKCYIIILFWYFLHRAFKRRKRIVLRKLVVWAPWVKWQRCWCVYRAHKPYDYLLFLFEWYTASGVLFKNNLAQKMRK